MAPVLFQDDDKRTGPGKPFVKAQGGLARFDRSNSILGGILELDGYRQVKLDRTPHDYRRVTDRIGNDAVSLLVDTGAARYCIDRKITARLGLKWRNTGDGEGGKDNPRTLLPGLTGPTGPLVLLHTLYTSRAITSR